MTKYGVTLITDSMYQKLTTGTTVLLDTCQGYTDRVDTLSFSGIIYAFTLYGLVVVDK